ncbi:MAG: FAD:protein FMN transferase, partial [Alphaproteobacteria bacterium]
GVALGARASITLYDHDATRARALLDRAVAEIARLEAVFSLFRAESALSRLNAAGRLDDPPLDLVRLLDEARYYAHLTHGAFDPTVAPLWRLYADHFARAGADPAGPDAARVAAARALVDYRALSVTPRRIVLHRRGAAVTLNGIAQGHITDRVAELLRAAGLRHVLLDLGEVRALGTHPAGRPWRVGIADPANRARTLAMVDLDDRALATSAGAGQTFDAAGRFHHLFDPRTGRSTDRYVAVSVLAATATRADALSTAFSCLDETTIQRICRHLGRTTAVIAGRDGRVIRLGA